MPRIKVFTANLGFYEAAVAARSHKMALAHWGMTRDLFREGTAKETNEPSAVEAAMGLASQTGNQVTVSYRSERFSRIKERNANRIDDFMRSGKLKVLFNSNPVEFKAEAVVLEVNGGRQEIPNDFVWIFAGGTPPNGFLKKIGVGFGARDLTLEASKEAKSAAAERKQLAQSATAPSR